MTPIRVAGLRRSGNHAVIDWVRAAIPGGSVFLNDCRPGDPYDSFQMLETPQGETHGPSFRATRRFAQFPRHRADVAHVVSYEDQAPDNIATTGWDRPFRTLIVQRSFLNWLASYLALVVDRQGGTAWGVDDPAQVAGMFDIYIAMHAPVPEAAVLRFDGWLHDAALRAALLADLQLTPQTAIPAQVPPYGGGSSFDGQATAPRPDRLTNRWPHMAHRPDFAWLCRAALGDAALMDVLHRHWPHDPARLRRVAFAANPH